MPSPGLRARARVDTNRYPRVSRSVATPWPLSGYDQLRFTGTSATRPFPPPEQSDRILVHSFRSGPCKGRRHGLSR